MQIVVSFFGPIISGLREQRGSFLQRLEVPHIKGAMNPRAPSIVQSGLKIPLIKKNFVKRFYLRKYNLEISFVAATAKKKSKCVI